MRKPKKLKMKKDQSIFVQVNIDALPIPEELKQWCRDSGVADNWIEIPGLTENEVREFTQ